MLGKCGICGSDLTIQNSESFAERQQVRVRHVPGNCAQVLYAKLTRFIAAYESMRRRFGDEYEGRFAECDALIQKHDAEQKPTQ
jgi:hypothetical protein